MRSKRLWGLFLTGISCAILTGAPGFRASAAATGTVPGGNIAAFDNKLNFNSADVVCLCEEVDSLQRELDDSVFGGQPAGGAVAVSADRLRDSLNSRGTIDYDDGTVIVDAGDLLSLADHIDDLGDGYATMIYRALCCIGTYFDSEGNVNHEANKAVDPPYLSCEQLAAGILQSQSVGHLAASPVISDNITAGTAAWVNGQYIIGNGADNERAYQRGVEDGKAGDDSDMDLRYTYHEHTGNGETGWEDGQVFKQTNRPGGCFTKGSHEHDNCSSASAGIEVISWHNYSDGCDWHPWEDSVVWQHECKVCHGLHHHEYPASELDELSMQITVWNCDQPHTHFQCGDLPINRWRIGCGKKAGQTESVTVYFHGSNAAAE